MIYNFTIEEQSKIDVLWDRLDEKIEQRKAAPHETPKETVLDYIQRLNKEFNNILGEIEKEHFKSLKSPQEIIKDAEKVIKDAILFEYAGNAYGLESTEETAHNCINLTKEYTQLMGDVEFLTWNHLQEQYKKVKENPEPPKVKLVKSGMLYFLEQRAIAKHIAALKGTAQEEELKKVINDCLDNSKYIIDDQYVKFEPLEVQSPRASYQKKEIVLDSNYDVAMANNLIVNGVNTLSANELKLLRLAIMQSKKGDTELYEYEIAAQDLAAFLNINTKNLYMHIDKMTDHIQQSFIKIKNDETQRFYKQSWVDRCEYNKGLITIKLAEGLKPYILGLKNCFSKIKIEEYINYKSKHTIIIRELLEAKMGSEKPHADVVIEIPITVEELKRVTNTEKDYKQISEFKARVLNTAIKEINDYYLGYHITAVPYKNGRSIEGFNFIVESQAHYDKYHKQEENNKSVKSGRKKSKQKEKTEVEQLTLKDFFNQEF
jgi:plasmid replication initiation protein